MRIAIITGASGKAGQNVKMNREESRGKQDRLFPFADCATAGGTGIPGTWKVRTEERAGEAI